MILRNNYLPIFLGKKINKMVEFNINKWSFNEKKGECIYVNLLRGLDMVVSILRLYVPYINFP